MSPHIQDTSHNAPYDNKLDLYPAAKNYHLLLQISAAEMISGCAAKMMKATNLVTNKIITLTKVISVQFRIEQNRLF
jgi:hypothetical protein